GAATSILVHDCLAGAAVTTAWWERLSRLPGGSGCHDCLVGTAVTTAWWERLSSRDRSFAAHIRGWTAAPTKRGSGARGFRLGGLRRVAFRGLRLFRRLRVAVRFGCAVALLALVRLRGIARALGKVALLFLVGFEVGLVPAAALQ